MSTESSESHLSNVPYIEGLFEAYRANPDSVAPEWQAYFRQGTNGGAWPDRPHLGPATRPRSLFNPSGVVGMGTSVGPGPGTAGARATEETVVEDTKVTGFQDRVGQLIRNYRLRGHVVARFDPRCTWTAKTRRNGGFPRN
jgi:2-oxoglutarate dehydrogenase E1 component